MKVERIEYNTKLWNKAINFAENCSSDWEAFFVAIDNENIIGYCSFLKEDYYPENRYSPWISSVFVGENYRGKKVSYKMIETVISYAKEKNFSKVYILNPLIHWKTMLVVLILYLCVKYKLLANNEKTFLRQLPVY